MSRDITCRTGLVKLNLHIIHTVSFCVSDVIAIHVVRIFAVSLTVDKYSTSVIVHTFPVVIGFLSRTSGCHVIAIDEIAARHSGKLLRRGIPACTDSHFGDCLIRIVRWPRLVIVVHDVDIATTRSAIAGTARLVVIHHAVT